MFQDKRQFSNLLNYFNNVNASYMVPITPTTFLNSPLPASAVLEANLWFTLTRPSHCPPSHRTPFPGPLFIVPPKWPASLNSRPVLALGTFCLHRLIYAFRTLTDTIYLLLHCHHQNDFCIKMGSEESHFNVSLGSDGQSRRTVSTNHSLLLFLLTNTAHYILTLSSPVPRR